jgi:hypothetical protein
VWGKTAPRSEPAGPPAWAADTKRTRSNVPTFETLRFALREVVERDAPAYERHFADFEVIRNLTSAVPWPYPDGVALEYTRTQVQPNQGKNWWLWGIFLKEYPSEPLPPRADEAHARE